MPGIKRNYTIKANKLKLVAFKARIDKSRAILRPARQFEETYFSPYFTRTSRQQKPLTCSLLPHEAEAYCYKLPPQSERLQIEHSALDPEVLQEKERENEGEGEEEEEEVEDEKEREANVGATRFQQIRHIKIENKAHDL